MELGVWDIIYSIKETCEYIGIIMPQSTGWDDGPSQAEQEKLLAGLMQVHHDYCCNTVTTADSTKYGSSWNKFWDDIFISCE